MKLTAQELEGFEFYDKPDALEPFAAVHPATGNYLQISPDKKSLEFTIAEASYDQEPSPETESKNTHFFVTLNYAIEKGWNPIIITPQNFGTEPTDTLEKNLAERIEKEFPQLLKRGEPTLFHGTYEDGAGFIIANIRTTNAEEIAEFAKRYLTFLADTAKQSLEKNNPNYKINIHKLADALSAHLGTKIDVTGLPEKIEGFTEYGFDNKAGRFMQNTGYAKAIVQTNGTAFTYDDNLEETAKKIVAGITEGIEKSKAIFEWILTNIPYDKEKKRPFGIEYRSALQTYNERKGVCGEMAALQAVMERLTGERSFLVLTKIGGEKHMCTAHILPDNKVMLVDPAQKTFDAKYSDFEIVSDEHSLAGYD